MIGSHLFSGRVHGGLAKKVLTAASIGILLTSLTACGLQESAELTQIKKDQASLKEQNEQLQSRMTTLQSENQQLKSKLDELQAGTFSKPAVSTATATPASSPAKPEPAKSAATTAPASGFSDISGLFGETEILALAKLKVFDSSSPAFEPHKAISRGEFIRWLVRANNAYSGHPIRLAEEGPARFPDVPESHPDFKYIQALVNTGYVVGFDDKTFKPDSVLTREQMLATKDQIDCEKPPDKNVYIPDKSGAGAGYADFCKVGERYRSALGRDVGAWLSPNNFKHVYQNSLKCEPQKSVSRAEAAVCLAHFRGNGGGKVYAPGTPSVNEE